MLHRAAIAIIIANIRWNNI